MYRWDNFAIFSVAILHKWNKCDIIDVESPIYTKNDQFVTLILKNGITERNVKRGESETTQDQLRDVFWC